MYTIQNRVITLIFLNFTILASASPAEEVPLFSNNKEARSQLIPKSKTKFFETRVEEYKTELEQVEQRLQEISTKQNVCEEEVIKAIDQEIPGKNFEEKVHTVRSAQLIDNITESILLEFPYKYFLNTEIEYHEVDRGLTNWPQGTSTTLIASFQNLNDEMQRKLCWGQLNKNLIHNINIDLDKKIKHKHALISLYQDAFEADAIAEHTKNYLTALAKENDEKTLLTLDEYIRKIRTIRKQFPEAANTTPANLPSNRLKKLSTLTYREEFMKKYDFIQITLLRNTLVKMRERFESNQIEIHILNSSQEETEIIPLDPMERYRFVVKLFRKEWDTLNNHSSFKGINIKYTDFLLAGFETGLIAANELDQLLKLEELWNPHKPWWEKAVYWGTTIGGAVASFIPPPYGYIAVLGIVVIEGIADQFKTKGGPSENQSHSLF